MMSPYIVIMYRDMVTMYRDYMNMSDNSCVHVRCQRLQIHVLRLPTCSWTAMSRVSICMSLDIIADYKLQLIDSPDIATMYTLEMEHFSNLSLAQDYKSRYRQLVVASPGYWSQADLA